MSYFVEQHPYLAGVATSPMFEDVPGVELAFPGAGDMTRARTSLTGRVRVSRPGGGLVVCHLWLGDEGPHLLEAVEVLAPEDGSESVPTYVAVRNARYFFFGMAQVRARLQVARDADSTDATCKVEGAALEVAVE